jgi:hypothetical protein
VDISEVIDSQLQHIYIYGPMYTMIFGFSDSVSVLTHPAPLAALSVHLEKNGLLYSNSLSLTGRYSRFWLRIGVYTGPPSYIGWQAGIRNLYARVTISPSQGLRIWLLYSTVPEQQFHIFRFST